MYYILPRPATCAFALEVDRGTETLGRLVEKGELYRSYWWGRQWKSSAGHPMPAVVTSCPARARNIRRKWKEIRGDWDWVVTCWDWLETCVLGGDWLDTEAGEGPLFDRDQYIESSAWFRLD